MRYLSDLYEIGDRHDDLGSLVTSYITTDREDDPKGLEYIIKGHSYGDSWDDDIGKIIYNDHRLNDNKYLNIINPKISKDYISPLEEKINSSFYTKNENIIYKEKPYDISYSISDYSTIIRNDLPYLRSPLPTTPLRSGLAPELMSSAQRYFIESLLEQQQFGFVQRDVFMARSAFYYEDPGAIRSYLEHQKGAQVYSGRDKHEVDLMLGILNDPRFQGASLYDVGAGDGFKGSQAAAVMHTDRVRILDSSNIFRAIAEETYQEIGVHPENLNFDIEKDMEGSRFRTLCSLVDKLDSDNPIVQLFVGGTLGNLESDDNYIAANANLLRPGDSALIGIHLIGSTLAEQKESYYGESIYQMMRKNLINMMPLHPYLSGEQVFQKYFNPDYQLGVPESYVVDYDTDNQEIQMSFVLQRELKIHYDEVWFNGESYIASVYIGDKTDESHKTLILRGGTKIQMARSRKYYSEHQLGSPHLDEYEIDPSVHRSIEDKFRTIAPGCKFEFFYDADYTCAVVHMYKK